MPRPLSLLIPVTKTKYVCFEAVIVNALSPLHPSISEMAKVPLYLRNYHSFHLAKDAYAMPDSAETDENSYQIYESQGLTLLGLWCQLYRRVCLVEHDVIVFEYINAHRPCSAHA